MTYQDWLWLAHGVLTTALCGLMLAIVADGFLRDRKETAR